MVCKYYFFCENSKTNVITCAIIKRLQDIFGRVEIEEGEIF